MRIVGLLTLLITLLTIPTHAQDATCQPDVASIIDLLTQSQTADDPLIPLTDASSQLNLLVASCFAHAENTAGGARSNPVPPNQYQTVKIPDDTFAEIAVTNYWDDAAALTDKQPDPGMRFIVVEIDYRCSPADVDKTCILSSSSFDAIGSAGVQYSPYNLGSEYTASHQLYGGGQMAYKLAFMVEAGETSFVLKKSASSGGQNTFWALQ